MSQEPRIIKRTTVELNATPKHPKEIKPVHIWCDGIYHQAMVKDGNNYIFGGSEPCDCNEKDSKTT